MQNEEYKYTSKKIDEVTVVFDIVVPWKVVSDVKENVLVEMLQSLEVHGFRKGKVPRHIGEKEINKKKLVSQTVQNLAQKIYAYIVKKENITPVIEPKVSIDSTKENTDWKFTIHIALKPVINYEKIKIVLNEIRNKNKASQIWTPNKGIETQSDTSTKNSPDEKSKKLKEIIDKLITTVSCPISPLIIETELSKRIASLIDDLHKTGLTIDAYLSSKKTTIESLKESIKNEIKELYSLEFILNSIAEHEKISVDKQDFDTLIQNAPDEKTKETIKTNLYYYAPYLLRQKTIDFLINL